MKKTIFNSITLLACLSLVLILASQSQYVSADATVSITNIYLDMNNNLRVVIDGIHQRYRLYVRRTGATFGDPPHYEYYQIYAGGIWPKDLLVVVNANPNTVYCAEMRSDDNSVRHDIISYKTGTGILGRYCPVDGNTPPNVPQQVAPASGSVTRNLSVTLKVQDRGDPDNYPRNYRDYYYRIEKTDGTWSRESGWTTNTTWTVTVPSRGTYRWRVRAGDGELASGWTGWWTLIVSIAEPVPPPTPPPGGSCPVPFYWQGDPRWASNHFGTCSCTIGGCGCAITSLAMLFKYYGINHDPGSLAACLGRSACPLAWSSACSGDKATYNGWKAFNWSLLETELQRGRPVILQLNRSGGMHFVVAVSGSGTRAQDYLVNDPALKQGTRISLSAVLVRMNYTPNSMRLFSGAPSCQISDAGDESMLTISGIASTDLPAKQGDGAIVPSSTQPITGTVIMYRNTEADMTLELAAQSSVGNVTEMLIWTNSITNTTWQPFAQYAELPLSEEFFVRFRDDAGNVSVPISNTSDPVASPPESNAVFLPLIMR